MEITHHKKGKNPPAILDSLHPISCAWTASEFFKDPQEINQQMQGGKQPQ